MSNEEQKPKRVEVVGTPTVVPTVQSAAVTGEITAGTDAQLTDVMNEGTYDFNKRVFPTEEENGVVDNFAG